MKRQTVIAGNWKMFKTNAEAEAMVKELRTLVDSTPEVEVVVCPPFTALAKVSEALKKKLKKLLTTELLPIMCVGELLSEREAGRVAEVVLGQMERGLAGLT